MSAGLEAMRDSMDHRGPEFGEFTLSILERLKTVFKTEGPVITYPSSGTGAWEAALVNTLSPGDRVLMFETGQFATLWQELAGRLGLVVDMVEGDWRHGVSAGEVESRLSEEKDHAIKAVCVVHNETSTGVVSNVAAVRTAMDAASHPALLFVDTISSLASVDYRHDEWGVDVTVSGWDAALESIEGAARPAVRLGLSMLRGMKDDAAERIERARAVRPFLG